MADERREVALEAIRRVESDPAKLAVSSHVLAGRAAAIYATTN